MYLITIYPFSISEFTYHFWICCGFSMKCSASWHIWTLGSPSRWSCFENCFGTFGRWNSPGRSDLLWMGLDINICPFGLLSITSQQKQRDHSCSCCHALLARMEYIFFNCEPQWTLSLLTCFCNVFGHSKENKNYYRT